jgi:serine/threonine protein kinase
VLNLIHLKHLVRCHPFVVRLVGTFQSPSACTLVLDKVDVAVDLWTLIYGSLTETSGSSYAVNGNANGATGTGITNYVTGTGSGAGAGTGTTNDHTHNPLIHLVPRDNDRQHPHKRLGLRLLSPQLVVFYAAEVASALAHLHSLDIAHRHLKVST